MIGGSFGKAGAAAMAGFAALRAGAGLVDGRDAEICAGNRGRFHPELMTEPLPETEAWHDLAAERWDRSLNALLERKTLAIGPGISRHAETADFVRT